MPRNIAVVSGKGGVGKTTVAVNLAYALHSLGENTLLVDANLNNPHVGLHLGEGVYEKTVHDVLAGKIGFSQAISYHPSGLKLAPGDLMGPPISSSVLLNRFRNAADWVLFDCPSGDADHVLEHADQVLIVTQGSVPALTDAKKLLMKLEKDKIVAGVVLNGGSSSSAEQFLGLPIASVIPQDKYFGRALLRKEPYTLIYPNRRAARAFRRLASRMSGKPL